jgi:hypothetical protein
MSDTTNKILKRVYEALPRTERAVIKRKLPTQEETSQGKIDEITDVLRKGLGLK